MFSRSAKLIFATLVASASLFCFCSFSQENPIEINEPSDKVVTYKDRLPIKGRAAFTKEVIVNGLSVGVKPDGTFSAGLILHPGKNLVEIKADKSGQPLSRKVRILREIQFPDMEVPYSGKPHWAKNDVIAMSTLGVVEGYPDNSFKPKKTITRGELATWVARAKDLMVKDLIEDVFFDVPKEHWRAPFIRATVDSGYMGAETTTYFGIENDIKRGKVAGVIDKVEDLALPDMVTDSPFTDVPANHPDAAAIYAAFRGKMIIGVSTYRMLYQPDRPMNRAEAAKLLSRVSNVKSKLGSLYDFEKGFDDSRLCKVNTPPVITDASIVPSAVTGQDKVLLMITAKVSDLQGLSDISEVKIDLSSIGGPVNAMMYDDGAHGDETAVDGTYSLKVAVQPGGDAGIRYIKIYVTDKSGAVTTETLKLEVKK